MGNIIGTEIKPNNHDIAIAQDENSLTIVEHDLISDGYHAIGADYELISGDLNLLTGAKYLLFKDFKVVSQEDVLEALRNKTKHISAFSPIPLGADGKGSKFYIQTIQSR